MAFDEVTKKTVEETQTPAWPNCALDRIKNGHQTTPGEPCVPRRMPQTGNSNGQEKFLGLPRPHHPDRRRARVVLMGSSVQFMTAA